MDSSDSPLVRHLLTYIVVCLGGFDQNRRGDCLRRSGHKTRRQETQEEEETSGEPERTGHRVRRHRLHQESATCCRRRRRR